MREMEEPLLDSVDEEDVYDRPKHAPKAGEGFAAYANMVRDFFIT